MSGEIGCRRALLVLGTIDEILTTEKAQERERDVRFVELGECLCEVRAKQYWRLEKLKSFDEFLEKRFPESRRKAYYLMAIREKLPRIPKPELREVGWSKAIDLVRVAKRDGEGFDCATWLHKAKELPKEGFKLEVELPFGQRNRTLGDHVFQTLQEPIEGGGESDSHGRHDAGDRQI